jgi:Tfp pilus assembly protein PilF
MNSSCQPQSTGSKTGNGDAAMKTTHTLSLLLLLLPSCALPFAGLDEEQQKKVDLFTENAESYLLDKKIIQAQSQIDQGLEIDPGNYYLSLYKGWAELLRGREQAEYYISATETLTDVVDMRSQSNNDYRAFLFLGQAQLGLAESYRKEERYLSKKLDDGSVNADTKAKLEEDIAKNKKKGAQALAGSESTFRILLDSGESDLQARRFLFLVEAQKVVGKKGADKREQIQSALSFGSKFLEEAEKRRKTYLDQSWRALNSEVESMSRKRRYYFEDIVKETNSLLASLYERDGQIDKAIACLSQNIKLDPKSPQDRFARGRLLTDQGKYGEARTDLDLFLRLTRLPFHSPAVTQANAMLRKMK